MSANETYTSACIWAAGWNVIPSKGPGDKTPDCTYQQYHKREKTREEAMRHSAMAKHLGSNPILLLNCWVEGRSLCVVDVDNLSKLKAVVQFFLELGVDLTATYQVSTGREGGGIHFYFLREAGREHQYRQQNSAKAFDKKAVDLKAFGNYVICPGAVHESGLAYKGNWTGTLAEIVNRLPTMPVSVWREATKTAGQENHPGFAPTLSIEDGPEWQTVIAGGARQACPWCGRGDNRVLSYDASTGRAYCFREEVARRLASSVPAPPAKVKVKAEPQPRAEEHSYSDLFRDAHLNYVEEATRLYNAHAPDNAGEWAQTVDVDTFLENIAGSNKLCGSGYDLSISIQNQTRKAYSKVDNRQAATALSVAAQTWSGDRQHLRPCRSGPIMNYGLTSFRASCNRYECEACGPRLIAASKHCGPPILDLEGYTHVATASLSASQKKELERWDGEWLCIATYPGQEQYLLLWHDHTDAPGCAYTVETDSAGAVYRRLLAGVSLPAWAACAGTRKILRGSRNLLKKLILLRDQLLGAAPLPGTEGEKRDGDPIVLPDGMTHKDYVEALARGESPEVETLSLREVRELLGRRNGRPVVSYMGVDAQATLIQEKIEQPFCYVEQVDAAATSVRPAHEKWQADTEAQEPVVVEALVALSESGAIPHPYRTYILEAETESDPAFLDGTLFATEAR